MSVNKPPGSTYTVMIFPIFDVWFNLSAHIFADFDEINTAWNKNYVDDKKYADIENIALQFINSVNIFLNV